MATGDGGDNGSSDEATSGEPRSYPQGFFTPTPGSSQILLIRHGQSEPYYPGRPFPLVDGHGDPGLTDLGHYQAELVGHRLALEPIGAIYVSTLTRTHQTAAPLVRALGLEPRVEPDVREVYLGEAEGGVLREMFAQDHPIAQEIRATNEWGVIPGAESNEVFTHRTVGAVLRIAERHRDQMVAVFCHGGVIGAVLAHAAGTTLGAFFGARHTSVNHLVISGDVANLSRDGSNGSKGRQPNWIIRSFNDAAHAGGLTGDHLPETELPLSHPQTAEYE